MTVQTKVREQVVTDLSPDLGPEEVNAVEDVTLSSTEYAYKHNPLSSFEVWMSDL